VLLYFISGLGHHNGTDLYFRGWLGKNFPTAWPPSCTLTPGASSFCAIGAIVACLILALIQAPIQTRSRNSEFQLHGPWAFVLAGLATALLRAARRPGPSLGC